jgi:hypothetical protein
MPAAAGARRGRRRRRDLAAFLARPSGRLPRPIEAVAVAIELAPLHEASGGATFNLYVGSLAGQRLYAVSLYPERGRIVRGQQVSPARLRQFIEANRDLLSDPRNSVGTWFDEVLGITYIDVSATLADLAESIALGRQYNQVAIYDLYGEQVIPIGGTGETVAGRPPVRERLPPFRSNPGGAGGTRAGS